MRLALALGRSDVDGMLVELTAEQMLEWMAFDAVEPIGGQRIDVAAAMVGKTMAEIFGAGKNLRLKDFMPQFGVLLDGEVKARPLVEIAAKLTSVFGPPTKRE